MRIRSPVGEYDYRITGMRLRRDGLEVDGSLGTWETTMVVAPRELAMATAVVTAIVVVLRRI